MKKKTTKHKDTKSPTYRQLRQKAQQLGIPRYSQMRKMELAKAIEFNKLTNKHTKSISSTNINKNNVIGKNNIILHNDLIQSSSDFLKYIVTKYDPEIKTTVNLAKNMAIRIDQLTK